MSSVTDWARDLLISRGALLEEEEAGSGDAVRALLPQEVAGALGAGEWLSLNFGTGAGADDPIDWMERLARLLPSGNLVTGVRMRLSSMAPRIDAESVLARELVIQNGIYRLVEEYGGTAQYFLFTFQYVAESDERYTGIVKVGVNVTAQSHLSQVNVFWSAIQNDIEDDPDFRMAPESIVGLYPFAAAQAQDQVRQLVKGLEETANRRLARDCERVESYYRGLLAQIAKRIKRKSGDAAAAEGSVEKEQSRAAATELDRNAKLEDLVRKYSLRVQVQPVSVLALRLPVREVVVRLIRKKEERTRTLHWNTVLKRLEPMLCEKCGRAAHPLHLCEKVHCLCQECWTTCASCGRTYCRICQSNCKCGSAGISRP
jgi:hypothetical protein